MQFKSEGRSVDGISGNLRLLIVSIDNIRLEFEGTMSEGYGYFDNWNYGDPRTLANAPTVSELKQMLTAFCTLDSKKFNCNDSSILQNNDEIVPEDDWTISEVEDYWRRKEEEEFEKFIQAVDTCIKSPDDIKSVSVIFEDRAPYVDAEIVEQYDFDKTLGSFEITKKAVEDGEDITDLMANESYEIDCGDDSLYFRFNYK